MDADSIQPEKHKTFLSGLLQFANPCSITLFLFSTSSPTYKDFHLLIVSCDILKQSIGSKASDQHKTGLSPVLENTALSCLEDIRLSAERKKENRVLTFSRQTFPTPIFNPFLAVPTVKEYIDSLVHYIQRVNLDGAGCLTTSYTNM